MNKINNMDKNKKQALMLFSAIIFLLLVFVTLSYLLLNSSGIIRDPSDSPRPAPLDDSSFEEPEKLDEIADLMDKVPHQGTFFSLTFDEDEGVYIIYINPDHKSEGEAELNEFLRQNGILNRQQLHFLKTSNVPVPTQAP